MPLVFAEKAFTDGKVMEDCLIDIRDGIIQSLSESADLNHLSDDTIVTEYLAPGFIDLQLNGGTQYHFTESPTREALIDIAEASEATGTPYLLPTCITSPVENIRRAITATRDFRREFPRSGVLGMHLEGPFISPKKRGAHLEKFIAAPEGELIDLLIADGGQTVKLLTFAPERFSEEQFGKLMQTGTVLSAGHSNATYEEAMDAFGKGVRVCTHLYNAMSAFGHRTPGLVGAVFDAPHVYAPIILDGIHCDFAAARIAYKQKQNKLLLISDALFLGRKKEVFRWEEFDARLEGDSYVNSEGNLAGGALSMGEMVANAVDKVGIRLEEAIEMATLRPASVLGLQDSIGRLAPGYPAVFTIFAKNLNDFKTLRI